MRRVVILTSGLFLVIALAGSAREPKNEDGPAAQLSKAPRKAQLLQNPFVGQETAAAAGRKLYRRCSGDLERAHLSHRAGRRPRAVFRSACYQRKAVVPSRCAGLGLIATMSHH